MLYYWRKVLEFLHQSLDTIEFSLEVDQHIGEHFEPEKTEYFERKL